MNLYYGWRIVIITIFVYVLVYGSVLACFSLYVVPVSAEFGLSRAQMNFAYVIINLGSAIWAPFIGRSLDRYPLKLVLGISALLLSLAFITLALSKWIWLSLIALALGISIGLDGTAILTMSVLVARWFRAQRTRAMTLSVTGQALGNVLVPLPMIWLIDSFGWRSALAVTGGVLTVTLTLIAIFIRERPHPDELEPTLDTGPVVAQENLDSSESRPANVADLLRLPHFWLIAVGMAMTFAISSSFSISLVPLGLGYGLSTTRAAVMVSLFAAAAIAAKLLLAIFADKISRLTLIMSLLMVGVPLWGGFLLVSGQLQLFVFVALLGLSVGGFSALYPVLQVDIFGLPSYGTVRGLMIPIQSAFVGIGAIGVGKIYDIIGNYDLMFIAFAIVQVAVIFILFLARRFHAKACAGEIRQ